MFEPTAVMSEAPNANGRGVTPHRGPRLDALTWPVDAPTWPRNPAALA